ncbi:uncharacterized protein EDB93DRAFT_1255342 [Suillus bovinus]|uniref:uncharacterized protein n=1 Tax=Suillus bovinus TaxID=48563 RepID=UPI001B86D3BC|nr:uncharacterized protein EDB93DRAFT_1255342 [Suillus bovinus]KAG2132157.1 hypothetical protein EDB93DRAFT_1255342 [Suillus bovinus]
MSSTPPPPLDSSSPPRFNGPHAYPSPTVFHQSDLKEPSSVDALCLPPFWGMHCDSDLTIALVSAKRSEHWAEYKLIQRHLRHINIEKELYSLVEIQTQQRLHKADTDIGVTHGVLHVSSLTPSGDEPDNDALSLGGSDGEESP